ncbi:hypothetical protein CAEBREN_07358 [Caenorhabditis brenneri]|uniref:Uncharacterized protein n=1 Tax=Caenorhabditis brenneri TaxID=135651 RepID=G0N6K7_CAEBE|nr:hypothetical protein CAEBREN_07358 [Caenorhabditis brenneri]
MGTLSQQEG